MPTPVNYGYPVKRPGLITQARFIGADDDLSLQITFTNDQGLPQAISLPCTANGVYGKICLPTTANITHIDRDAIIASVRMATMVGRAIPGSAEWTAALTSEQEGSMDLQLALGNGKVKELRILSDTQLEIDVVKKGTTSPVQTIQTYFQELGSYVFTPDTQMHCVAGAIEKQYPTYVHDYPTQVLTAQQKADIEAYVVTLALWV